MKSAIKIKIEKLRLENSKLSMFLYTKATREEAAGIKKTIKRNERKMNKLLLELRAAK